MMMMYQHEEDGAEGEKEGGQGEDEDEDDDEGVYEYNREAVDDNIDGGEEVDLDNYCHALIEIIAQ